MAKAEFELTGRHVAIGFCAAFGVIIAVNLTLAFQAVATFPGLETKNSYVASQTFDADRAAQEALGWDVSARVADNILRLTFATQDGFAQPQIESAILGRATSVAADETPDFTFDGQSFVAPVDLAAGNWNLRIRAIAADGTLFQQRVIVRVAS